MATLFSIPGGAFLGDTDAQLVAGDNPASPIAHKGRLVLAMDDTDEEAAVSQYLVMPSQYNGTDNLTVLVYFYMASDVTNDVAIDLYFEAVTPDTDTLDLESATSWDTAKSGTKSLSGTTAGDLLSLSYTFTNAEADDVKAGDCFRVGIRRDTDSVNDDATGDLFFVALEIRDAQ